jgi:hypothetical protein
MKIEHCIQGSADWFAARNGRVTASKISDVMQYLKQTKAEQETGVRRQGQKRIDYKTELIAGTLRGEALPHFVSDAMRWGIEQEALAATEYELESPEAVMPVGFVYHPTIERAGASPDRLVGKDGLLEVKCPETTTHLEWILAGVVPDEHRRQMLFQMRCCEREWCDFMSFDSRLPRRYQKFIIRLHADETAMDDIDSEVRQFLAEVDGIIESLDGKCPALAEEQPAPTEYGVTDEDIRAVDPAYKQ